MESIRENDNFIKIPYEFFKRGLSAVARLVLSKIFTFSKIPNLTSECRSSFRRFAEDFRVSERQIARKVKELKALNVVTQDKSGAVAAYSYTGKSCGKGFVRSDLFLYQKEFYIEREGSRFLTLSEILVFSLMMTHCSNAATGGKYTGSIRSIAEILGLSPSTVFRCVDVLKRANLIKCEAKAPNGSAWTSYRINKKYVNSAEHAYNKAGKSGKKTRFIDPQTAAADAKADRERFYSIARQRAEAPAEQIRQRLRKDDQYSAAERNYNRLISKIVAYEVHGQKAERDAAAREQKRWANVMARRMAAMNIRSEDLRPRYRCAKCSDTGFRPDDSVCDCYPGSSPGRT